MDSNTLSKDPKDRLLDEAEKLFAEKGYEAVSVREITDASQCNLAAVNYHFGGKRSLYLEVFRSRWLKRARRIQGMIRIALSELESPSIHSVIRAVVKGFFEGPFTEEERVNHAQLIHREFTRPTEAFDMVLEEGMKPFLRELARHLTPFLRERDPERVLLNTASILSMTLYFNFARQAITRISGREYDSEFKRELMEHIVTFCVHGLALKKEDQE